VRVFVAGATGAIGKRLVPLLVDAGHTVTGTTRHADKVTLIRYMGATPAIVNALSRDEVVTAVRDAKPDVIIHQLTAIPEKLNMRRFEEEFAATNRLRTEGTDNLMAAARAVGCPRLIAQSYAGWPYERSGGWVKSEEDRLTTSPEPGLRGTLDAIMHLESALLRDQSVEGFVLRYGSFYGPGTSLGEGGSLLGDVRKRRVPIIGRGTGYWSFLHIDDAATATLAAVVAERPGLYNIADDEPAPVSEWLPFLAENLGSKPPLHIPEWIARFAIGQHGVTMMTTGRGASNLKAKSSLRWRLKWPSWREGFKHGLGEHGHSLADGIHRASA
jgi:nucleoside-diphosphate-sugar epimerase